MPFDYQAFWLSAWAANASHDAPPLSDRVPRVYVYQLHDRTPWQDQRDPRDFVHFPTADPRTGTLGDDPEGGLNQRVFGPLVEHRPGAYTVNRNIGFNFAQQVLWRLAKSKIYFTSDPDEADLFYVPILTSGKLQADWPPRCRALSEALEQKNVSDWLPHLNEWNAHKHFTVYSKEHHTAEAYNCRCIAAPLSPLSNASMRAAADVPLLLALSHRPLPHSLAR